MKRLVPLVLAITFTACAGGLSAEDGPIDLEEPHLGRCGTLVLSWDNDEIYKAGRQIALIVADNPEYGWVDYNDPAFLEELVRYCQEAQQRFLAVPLEDRDDSTYVSIGATIDAAGQSAIAKVGWSSTPKDFSGDPPPVCESQEQVFSCVRG